MERLRELRARALAESPDAFRQSLADHERVSAAAWRTHFEVRAAAGDGALVAEACGVWVGFVIAIRNDDGTGRLGGMWVTPEARGRQVGRALVNAALAWLRAAEVRHVTVAVADGSVAARALLFTAGFEPTGARRELRPGNVVMAEELELELPPKSLRAPPPLACA